MEWYHYFLVGYMTVGILSGVLTWICLHSVRLIKRREVTLMVGFLWPIVVLLVIMLIADEIFSCLCREDDIDDYEE